MKCACATCDPPKDKSSRSQQWKSCAEGTFRSFTSNYWMCAATENRRHLLKITGAWLRGFSTRCLVTVDRVPWSVRQQSQRAGDSFFFFFLTLPRLVQVAFILRLNNFQAVTPAACHAAGPAEVYWVPPSCSYATSDADGKPTAAFLSLNDGGSLLLGVKSPPPPYAASLTSAPAALEQSRCSRAGAGGVMNEWHHLKVTSGEDLCVDFLLFEI